MTTNEALKKAWATLKSDNPRLRIRNAAEQLNVSELDLLLTELGNTVTRLSDEHGELLKSLEPLGSVMALSRNDQVVHEKHGIYQDFKVVGKGQMGLCLGDIDLRVFLGTWKHALAVQEGTADKPRLSIQFFDGSGTAIHKIYCTEQTDTEQWQSLIERFSAREQHSEFEAIAFEPEHYPNAGKVAAETVRAEWTELKDVHHFQAMLKRLGISRLETLALVGEDYAKALDVSLAEQALVIAQAEQVPLMLFVGNRGIVQIHTGVINKLLRTGPWFNVLDPDFNLHFNTEEVAQVWLVRRPTAEGIVTSLEIYNTEDQLVLTLFGERKPGQDERQDWRELVAQLENAQ